MNVSTQAVSMWENGKDQPQIEFLSDIAKFYQTLKDKGFKFFKELMVNEYQVNDEIYQDKEFLIQDPDGYLLRFNN